MVLQPVPFAGGHLGQESLHLRGIGNQLAVEVAGVPVDQHAAQVEDRDGGLGKGLFWGQNRGLSEGDFRGEFTQ